MQHSVLLISHLPLMHVDGHRINMIFYYAFVPEIIYQEEYNAFTVNCSNRHKLLHMHRQKIILGNCKSVCTIIAACTYLLCQCC